MQCKRYKVDGGYIKLDTMEKLQKDKKTNFTKNLVENRDLSKPVLKKIVTTHE